MGLFMDSALPFNIKSYSKYDLHEACKSLNLLYSENFNLTSLNGNNFSLLNEKALKGNIDEDAVVATDHMPRAALKLESPSLSINCTCSCNPPITACGITKNPIAHYFIMSNGIFVFSSPLGTITKINYYVFFPPLDFSCILSES